MILVDAPGSQVGDTVVAIVIGVQCTKRTYPAGWFKGCKVTNPNGPKVYLCKQKVSSTERFVIRAKPDTSRKPDHEFRGLSGYTDSSCWVVPVCFQL